MKRLFHSENSLPFSLALCILLLASCTAENPTAPELAPALEADAAAGNAKPETGVVRATFPGDEICGIPVTTEYFSAGATWVPAFPGNPPLRQTGTTRLTWTAANGKTVQYQNSGLVIREITEWIDERTFRATETAMGAFGAIRIPNGPILVHDVGRIVIGHLVHLPEDGGFIDLEPPSILEISGPHPNAESNFTLRCEIITDALT